jgi:hypothetical protein
MHFQVREESLHKSLPLKIGVYTNQMRDFAEKALPSNG